MSTSQGAAETREVEAGDFRWRLTQAGEVRRVSTTGTDYGILSTREAAAVRALADAELQRDNLSALVDAREIELAAALTDLAAALRRAEEAERERDALKPRGVPLSRVPWVPNPEDGGRTQLLDKAALRRIAEEIHGPEPSR